MASGYHNYSTINRTVLRVWPVGPVDVQGLPPWGWCVVCGAEVFRPGRALCRRCRCEAERRTKEREVTIKN